MPLEKLHSLIESLKERIKKHGEVLRGSEALTRYTLIDPLLRELGWNTEDPALVIPEYKSGKGQADYALMGADGNPVIMIEAKKLDSSLQDSALTQGIQYCLEKGTKYFALTDGSCWDVYESHRPVPIDEKRVVSFDLGSQATPDACLQTLALWQPNLETGRAVAGSASLIPPSSKLEPTKPAPVLQDESGWNPLTILKPKSGSKPPIAVRFPDDSSQPIEHWKGIIVEVTRWLANQGHLDARNCPIQYSPRSSKYIVATNPVHPNKKEFRDSREVDFAHAGKLYVETHSSSSDCVKKSTTIVKHVGLDPAKFRVRFD